VRDYSPKMAFRMFALFAVVATVSAGLLPEIYNQQYHRSEDVGAPIYEDVQENSGFHQHLGAGHQQQKTIVYQQEPNHNQHILGSEHYQQQQLQGTHDVLNQGYGHEEEEHYEDTPAEYEFSFDVHDEKTGDIKQQKEIRKGDFVQGEYSLVDADGHLRTVTYTADKHSGFNAQVRREEIKGFKATVQQHLSEGYSQDGHSGYISEN
jgi:hypothetical protein